MNTKYIFLCYRTDSWLSNDSRELVYIGENKEDAIAKLSKFEGMTKEQAKQVRETGQSQCSEGDCEWLFEKVLLNSFC